MGEFIEAGGLGMIPTLAFGLLFLAVGIAQALLPARRLLTLFLILGLVVFVMGVLGTTMGFIQTFMAVPKLPPAEQYGTMLLGLAESLHNLLLALVFVVLSTLILAGGALRAALAAGREPKGS